MYLSLPPRILELLVDAVNLFDRFHRQGSENIKPLKPETLGRNIAILVPHPDDEIIGCFHFLEKFAGEIAVDLIYVTCSGDDHLKITRVHESEKATESLRISSRIYWDLPEGELLSHYDELRARMTETRSRYSTILSPAPNDQTPDHAIIASEALQVICAHQLIWYRSTWLTFRLSEADFVISGSPEKKKAALQAFVSQRALALRNSVGYARIEAKHLGHTVNSIEGFRYAVTGMSTTEPLNTLSAASIFRIWDWM